MRDAQNSARSAGTSSPSAQAGSRGTSHCAPSCDNGQAHVSSTTLRVPIPLQCGLEFGIFGAVLRRAAALAAYGVAAAQRNLQTRVREM